MKKFKINLNSYFPLVVLVAFLAGTLYYLINQPYFSPYQESGTLNYFSIGVFLTLVFFLILLLVRLIQKTTFDVWIHFNEDIELKINESRFFKGFFAFLTALLLESFLFFKIFGILDPIVLLSAVVLYVLLIWVIK